MEGTAKYERQHEQKKSGKDIEKEVYDVGVYSDMFVPCSVHFPYAGQHALERDHRPAKVVKYVST